jgi:hypothetical protein
MAYGVTHFIDSWLFMLTGMRLPGTLYSSMLSFNPMVLGSLVLIYQLFPSLLDDAWNLGMMASQGT